MIEKEEHDFLTEMLEAERIREAKDNAVLSEVKYLQFNYYM